MLKLYEKMGGEEGIKALVERFYKLMDTLPEVKTIRDMHPSDLGESREKLFAFLSGWSGGPQLFMERYGHPRLRMRHAPFAIGKDERDQWLLCMNKALEESNYSEEVKSFLSIKFSEIADFMRNQDEDE